MDTLLNLYYVCILSRHAYIAHTQRLHTSHCKTPKETFSLDSPLLLTNTDKISIVTQRLEASYNPLPHCMLFIGPRPSGASCNIIQLRDWTAESSPVICFFPTGQSRLECPIVHQSLQFKCIWAPTNPCGTSWLKCACHCICNQSIN